MSLNGTVILPPTTQTSRPVAGTKGRMFYNSTYNSFQIDNGTNWVSIGAKDGSSMLNAAASALSIKSLTGTTSSGTYWILVNGIPTELYCDMTTSGGGWMSFASAPSTRWFAGNTGLGMAWSGLNYSYGTYLPSGSIGNYWRSYHQQSVTELLFKTGNGIYWIHIKLSDVYLSPNGNQHSVTAVATSNNFPATQYEPNTKVTIMHRITQPEDPWINAGNVHANGGDASGTDYMFWGENNLENTSHGSFRSNNGGILVFVR